MNRDKFLEMSYLYILNELSPLEKEEFEKVLNSEDELKNEFEETKKFYSLLDSGRQKESDDALLAESRRNLMHNIRIEAEKESLWENLKKLFGEYFLRNYKLALSGIATIAVGIFIGYLIFAPGSGKGLPNNADPLNKAGILSSPDVNFSNIKLPDTIPSEGEIEISFEAVKPVNFKGNLNDPLVKRLLASVLTSETNPGIRLRTANAIAAQPENSQLQQDPKIKQALISALKKDPNDAVRREALIALSKYTPDADIRNSILYVLAHDNNAGLRVAAINALSELRGKGLTLDEPAKKVLQQNSENDKNSFVRIQASSILNETN